jgi:anti-sigma regulatory factor (Ser/Thr protein kinase)
VSSMRFTRDPECVGACRDFVEQALGSRPVELVDRAVLVTSELVTNVIRHTSDGGVLEVVVGPDHLRLEVSDFSHRQPVEVHHSPRATGGMGLPIVSSLSSSWGVQESRAGKTVWATFDPR